MVWLCKVDVLPGQASLSHPAVRFGLWLLLQHRFPNVQKTICETSSNSFLNSFGGLQS